VSRRAHAIAAALLVAAGAALSWGSALTESFTTDEPSHLTAGASYLATGDFRINPEHPPLAKVWAALPLGLVRHAPFTRDLEGWSFGETTYVMADWLERRNDGNRLLRPARFMMVVLFAGLCAAIGWTAHRLLGPGAGLLATALAAFEPLLLAHGHYVTTDVPVTLCVTLSLLSFAAFLRRRSAVTFAAAAAAFAASALVKYSWVLLVPSLVLMTAVAVRRHRAARGAGTFPWGRLAAFPALVVAAIWAAYGFRFDPFRPGGPPPPTDRPWLTLSKAGWPVPYSPPSRDEAWANVHHDVAGNPRTGLSVSAVQLARRARLLPEAYLYGFTFATRYAEARKAYLHGRFSPTGWRGYFAVAYLVKTPLPVLLLLLGGAAALATRRARVTGDPVLAAGVLTFAAVYGATAVLTNLNIGLRHVIPVYPALIVVASASAAWVAHRAGRVAVLLLAAWTAVAAAAAFPYYLGYFNEIAGGWRGGHRWLVDSNLDWDQDFLRIRDYERAHPDERTVLLSLGDPPRPPGLRAEVFAPRRPGQSWPSPTAGTYLISATWLVGTFQQYSRDEAWESPRLRSTYEALWRRWSGRPAPGPGDSDEARNAYTLYDGLRRALLLQRLHQRAPDERIGTSTFVYRLSDAEIAALTRPD